MAISSKSARELIEELNETDETESLEAKAISFNDLGVSFFETVCALSNEPDLGGGTLLLGVQKQEEGTLFPYYAVTGVSDVDKITADISNGCASRFNLPIRVDIQQDIVNGGVVIRVDVPELLHTQKPVYFRNQGLPRGAFRRIGATDQHCTDDDLIAFFQTKAHDPFDSSIVENVTWEDIDETAIANYRRARQSSNPLAEELNWPNNEILHALGAIKKVNDQESITATGLVVFGTTAALRRERPALRVDYIRVPGKEWMREPDHRFDAIDFRAPLMNAVARIITSILDDLPRAFRLEEGETQRTDMPLVPARVVREAVVNAVMHRNYQSDQPIQIIRYANRLEIRNPGYSLKSQERFDEPGSAIRNPHIAEILHETRFAETKGSGIRVMRERMAQMGLAEPTFVSNRDNDEFTTILLFHHFLSEDDWSWLSLFKRYSLTEEQMRALIFVREVGAIDNSSFRNTVKTDTLNASSQLRRLRELDLLESRGSGSRTYYVPGTAYQDIVSSISSNGNGAHDTMHARASSMHGREGIQFREVLSRLPPELQGDILFLGRRIEPAEAERLILALCAAQPLSADEIALMLDRTKNYISNKYLYRMVRDGKLRYLHPEMVKHPTQKYVTVDRSSED